ncbi:MAG: pyrroline-5-carboxylate reductase [Opitutus sp.]|nr:pyrroline-5-carboxylate reductase [Opitutus sp.]MCS6247853.1 pyrroline-5-carboxylate reductase [Opitutus sp.]MCS6274166.1 pyrroline-5-carboxylate reductase [Opitutus sp.]MCS6278940.1 pyrroline-5-carboxylate reductase [Opitutus sp.]MCS6298690.1 pyrroline-5-carboxylate reductase [Opitutus sp.]
MPKIAFIGAGNMASAIVTGLLAKNVCTPADLACLGGTGASAQKLADRTGIRLAATAESLLADADIVVVAFKPQHLAALDPHLAALCAGKLVISVLAAKTLARLASAFPSARNIVRTMPNTPSAIGAGMTGWCALAALTATDRATVLKLLRAVGREVEVPENQMEALMGVSGCGPAFVFEFTAALREAGVAAGLDRDTAQMLAVQTLLGSARLMAETATEPETLRNQVTSPNGTTFAGLKRLEAREFRAMMVETVQAAKARAEELAQG